MVADPWGRCVAECRDEKVGIRTEVRHRVPSCTSNQLFNGIAAGHAVVKFYGKIVVAPDAHFHKNILNSLALSAKGGCSVFIRPAGERNT